jgi:hypothetical protein
MSSVSRTEYVCKYIILMIAIETLTVKQINCELPDF